MMLVYSDARYKYTPGTKEWMLSDLAQFTLLHLGNLDSMTKTETFCGSEKREKFSCDDRASFTIITRHFADHRDVFWTRSDSEKMWGFTEYTKEEQ